MSNKNFASSLFKQYYQPLCKFAEDLIVNTHDAEDIVVNVFHKLLLQQDRFQNATDIRAYLFITTRNACLDYLKGLKKEKEHAGLVAYLNENATNGTDHVQVKAELLEKIHNAIEELSGNYKIVMQALAKGKETSDIAEEMGWTVQNVRNIKARAIKMLRIKLLDEGWTAIILLYHLFSD
jgi:RNA polymerase sigma factor (sigma-70 family)